MSPVTLSIVEFALLCWVLLASGLFIGMWLSSVFSHDDHRGNECTCDPGGLCKRSVTHLGPPTVLVPASDDGYGYANHTDAARRWH